MSTVIQIEKLSKMYELGQFGTGTISQDLKRWWALKRGKEDPFSKIGEENIRNKKGDSNVVWSLRDINFKVEQGERIGIIGKNGAGKSTLLKILSRVTAPTSGVVKMKGQVASLLEVGTGFHPELTGRENIYLNGSILGMTRQEIKKQFDAIVDFSGIERYIDTPVKRYSSGMHVRLGFAVAAHLQSEILIVDEVLAVGDMEFQKKCLGKMDDISKGEGRTILFVSHNLSSIKNLCNKGVLLKNGRVVAEGGITEVVDEYMDVFKDNNLISHYKKKNIENKSLELLEAFLKDKNGKEKSIFTADDDIFIELHININKKDTNYLGYCTIRDSQQNLIIESDSKDVLPNILATLNIGKHIIKVVVHKRILGNSNFVVYFNFTDISGNIDSPLDILSFSVMDTSTERGARRQSLTNSVVKWGRG